MPARRSSLLLTVIDRDPEAVVRALGEDGDDGRVGGGEHAGAVRLALGRWDAQRGLGPKPDMTIPGWNSHLVCRGSALRCRNARKGMKWGTAAAGQRGCDFRAGVSGR